MAILWYSKKEQDQKWRDAQDSLLGDPRNCMTRTKLKDMKDKRLNF